MTALVELNPIDPGTGSRVTLRVCASQSSDATGAGGFAWWPAITVQPVLSMTLFDGAFSSAVSVAQASMELRLDVLRNSGQFPRAERYDWSGATAVISRLVDGLPVLVSTMRVERFASEQDRLSLSLAVDEEPLEGNVLFSEYAGTGGAEGTADLRGKPKPWAFGRCINVEPVFIDKVDNVYQVSGYGPVQAIPAVYERGASFGASVGDFPSYAALVAANIPEGRWGTCLAQGMFRLGAPPAGVITCDVDGDSTAGFIRRTGAIVQEVARRLSVSARINATSLNALDAAVARDVNLYLTQQTSLLDLARRMAAPCNAVAGLALDGRLIMPRVAFGAEQFTLDAQGRQMPPVLGMARKNTSPPFDEIKMGAARSWRVHSFDEIAFYDDLIDRGAYDAATVYREGNIVTSPDQSRWVYINPTPTAGNAPPTWPTASNAFWSNLAPPLDPPSIGVERGANVTANHVSLAIQNQGALATLNAVDLSGVNVAGTLPPFRADPGLVNANLLPAIGEAAASAEWVMVEGRPFALRDEAFDASGRIFANGLIYGNFQTVEGLRPAEFGANVTEDRTAAFVANQGALATQNTAAWSQVISRPFALQDEAIDISGRLIGDRLAYVDGATVQSLRPAELNANVTEGRVAAFVAGQAPAATDFSIEGGATRTAPANGNRVPFSRMEGDQGWQLLFNPNGLTVLPSYGMFVGLRFFKIEATATAAGQSISYGQQGPRFRITPGERLSIQARIEALGATTGWQLELWTFEPDGVIQTPSVIATGGSRALADDPVRAFFDVPAGRVFGRLELRLFTSGPGAVQTAFAEPMVTSAIAGQTIHPPFTPGPNAFDAADVTSQNTAAFLANQGALATANSASWSSQISGRPNALTDLQNVGGDERLQSHYIFDVLGGSNSLLHQRWPAEFGANVTEGRTAAFVSGQGALATQNNVSWGSQVAGRPNALTDLAFAGDFRIQSHYVYDVLGGSNSLLFERWPAEFGANVTEGRTAAFVAGQSPWVTTGIPTSRVSLLNDAGRAGSRRINSQLIASGILQTINTNPLSASTSGGVSTITVNAHDVFDDAGTISFSGASIGGLSPSTLYYVWESNPDFVGGARTYVATTDRNALTVFGRRSVGFIETPPDGSPPSSGGGGGAGGQWGGGGDIP